MKILIAEDERITRVSLQRELERWGHQVVAAEDGAIAWEQFQRGAFDLVVTDWDMPQMDGHELIQRIRATDKAGYSYLIMLTGRSETSDLVSGMEAGADDFLAKPFDRDELRVRLAAGERIINLEHRLADQNKILHKANERMQHDLEAAARIQQDLLPTAVPQIDGFQFAWHYRPCDELAGDLLNVIPIDEHRVALYVADVSGHGVAASLLSVAVHRSLTLHHGQTSLIVTPTAESPDFVPTFPHAVAEQLNTIYPMSSNGGHFITVIYGVLDLEKRTLRFCCAGHPGPVIVRANAPTSSIEVPGFPIGVVPDPHYADSMIEFQPGDRIYFFSDGFTEAANESRELLGSDRLNAIIGETRPLPIQESIEAIANATAKWQGHEHFDDDLSMLAIEID